MKITVFTPTYNRAYIIERLYRSLRRQTYKDFEWIVVDDGSNDNTADIFAKWKKEDNSFPIVYERQTNSGKCQAINKGLSLAKGTLFFTVDSDDYLTDDALEKIAEWESALPQDGSFCGIAANSGTSPVETVNNLFDEDYIDATAFERYGRLNGEKAMIFYTDIHRKYLYPYFEGEKFMTEAVVWNRMAHDGYKIRFFNDIIWIYEYQNEGLTKSGSSIFINNPMGYGLCLKEKSVFTNQSLLSKLKMYYTFTCDLSEKYPAGHISKCIGTFKVLIVFMKCIHSTIKFLKRIFG